MPISIQDVSKTSLTINLDLINVSSNFNLSFGMYYRYTSTPKTTEGPLKCFVTDAEIGCIGINTV